MRNRQTKQSILSLLVVFLLIASVFAGCKADTPAPSAEEKAPAVSEESVTGEESPSVEEEAPAEPADDGTREITDMAGRTLSIPGEIEKVYSTGPMTAIYMYMVSPDKLLGWNYELNDHEKAFTLAEYHDLPVFGMGEGVNYEAVIAAGPNIGVHVSKLDDAAIEEAELLSEKLGIPIVIVSDNLLDAPEVYRFLGQVLGEEEQAEALAAYAEKTLKEVGEANIPEEDVVSVYYGNGVDSLETAPQGSPHAQTLELVHAYNVADLEIESAGRVQVSLEQLLSWDPEYIVVIGEAKQDLTGNSAAEAILENPDFASLQAVQNGHVLGAPKAPFSWIDRPAGPNRIIGVRWLAAELYPEYFTYDVDQEVKDFFQLFYHIDLTDEQLVELYNS